MHQLHSVTRFLLMLALAGTVTGFSAEIGTLAGNKQLPAEAIKEFLPRADWEYLSVKKISHAVGFRASIRDDTSVRLGRIFRALPDASWNETAKTFAAKTRLNYSNSNSGLGPRADIYVILFEAEPSGDRLVLVYGEEAGTAGKPSEAPDPSVGQNAAGPRYIQTFPIEKPK